MLPAIQGEIKAVGLVSPPPPRFNCTFCTTFHILFSEFWDLHCTPHCSVAFFSFFPLLFFLFSRPNR